MLGYIWYNTSVDALKEIDYMVKRAQLMPDIKPVTYFNPEESYDPELPGLLAEYRKKMDQKRQQERQRFMNPVPKAVRLFQNRQMPDLPARPQSDGKPSGPFRNWQGWQNAKSTQMMANMNRRLTESDAYNEILRRRPGIDPRRAKLLAPMVAKNYRVNANGEWVNTSGSGGNRNIVAQFNKALPAIAGRSAPSVKAPVKA